MWQMVQFDRIIYLGMNRILNALTTVRALVPTIVTQVANHKRRCTIRVPRATVVVIAADADMVVKANLDELFDLPQGFYAVMDCTAGLATQQERDSCPLFGLSRYFNAGMLCFSPR